MTLETLLNRLKQCPLIASVQASERSPVDHPDTLLRLGRASVKEGVRVVRLEGVKTVRELRPEIHMPVIGLLKRTYPGSEVYITPTIQDANSMLSLGCEIIAFDGTSRERPHGHTVKALTDHIRSQRGLTLADCDSIEAALHSEAAGVDLIGTTLAGYTSARPMTDGPDLELLREIMAKVKTPVIAEGRYTQKWQVEAALRMGAIAVVVGGALNDPIKQTRALMPTMKPTGKIGAVDIGGTWLRFGVFSPDWVLEATDRVPLPKTGAERMAWVREKASEFQVERLGISTAGVVDPKTGEVWTAKEYLMPDHVGTRWTEETMGVPTVVFGDGHATAWGHANAPAWAGLRVATLAIGTGLGCGFVEQGRIWAGRRGEYPRVNDLPASGGHTYEGLLAGVSVGKDPDIEVQSHAIAALHGALKAINELYFPDVVVIAGGVGLSPWLAPHITEAAAHPTPFGAEAGLYGAAALALFPPRTCS